MERWVGTSNADTATAPNVTKVNVQVNRERLRTICLLRFPLTDVSFECPESFLYRGA
jgi:hypothetical protein